MTSGCDETSNGRATTRPAPGSGAGCGGAAAWLEAATLEPMRTEDLPTVLVIERESFPSAWSKESYLRELRNPSSHYVVARLEGQIIGYAGMWVVAEEAHVSTIAVRAERRRSGLGARLMLSLMGAAQAHGARRMTLEVREGNLAAQALYVKLGFQTTGLLHRYYGDTGENALVMCRQLTEELLDPSRRLG